RDRDCGNLGLAGDLERTDRTVTDERDFRGRLGLAGRRGEDYGEGRVLRHARALPAEREGSVQRRGRRLLPRSASYSEQGADENVPQGWKRSVRQRRPPAEQSATAVPGPQSVGDREKPHLESTHFVAVLTRPACAPDHTAGAPPAAAASREGFRFARARRMLLRCRGVLR